MSSPICHLAPGPAWLGDPVIRAIVRSAALRVVRELGDRALEAADVEQELFMALAKAMRRHDPARGNARTYARGVVAREVTGLLRTAHASRRRVHVCRAQEVELRSLPGAIGLESTFVVRHDLARALAVVSPADRELFELTAIGMPVAEVAARVGVHRCTIPTRVARLRRCLGVDGLLGEAT